VGCQVTVDILVHLVGCQVTVDILVSKGATTNVDINLPSYHYVTNSLIQDHHMHRIIVSSHSSYQLTPVPLLR
jgi:hypothetical protein